MTVAPSSVTLSDYLTQLRNILHDPNDQYWSQALKTLYITEAIQQRDIDTGGRRLLGTFTLTASQAVYTFTELSVAFASATGNIFDIVSVTLLYNGYRFMLEEQTYSELVTRPGYRAYVNTAQIPAAWSRYGDQAIYIAPAPPIAYDIEIDATIYSTPTALAALTDADAVQFPYTYPVHLYAAFLCKQNEREWDEADAFKARYDDAVGKITYAKTGQMRSPYPGR